MTSEPRWSPHGRARLPGSPLLDTPEDTHASGYGSTGVLTTVGDMLKWAHNLVDARVGGPTLASWMRTSGRLNDGTETGYGGGLRLAGYRGLVMLSHDGVDGGYRTEATLFPDQRLAIVALCNGATTSPTELTRCTCSAGRRWRRHAGTASAAIQRQRWRDKWIARRATCLRLRRHLRRRWRAWPGNGKLCPEGVASQQPGLLAFQQRPGFGIAIGHRYPALIIVDRVVEADHHDLANVGGGPWLDLKGQRVFFLYGATVTVAMLGEVTQVVAPALHPQRGQAGAAADLSFGAALWERTVGAHPTGKQRDVVDVALAVHGQHHHPLVGRQRNVRPGNGRGAARHQQTGNQRTDRHPFHQAGFPDFCGA
ncbi:serine hydrolase [Bacillus subtilis subsp. subtilis]|nr:serine hydrolase [Bacillus subtilis subsp. subtilis]